APHRFGTHMRSSLAFALEDVPLLDSGALGDPGIGGIDHPGQLVVGQDVGWNIAVDTGGGGNGGNGVGQTAYPGAGFFDGTTGPYDVESAGATGDFGVSGHLSIISRTASAARSAGEAV